MVVVKWRSCWECCCSRLPTNYCGPSMTLQSNGYCDAGTASDCCFELCFCCVLRCVLALIAVSARPMPASPSVDLTMTAPPLAAFALVTTNAMALTTSAVLSVVQTTIVDGHAPRAAAMTGATK